MKLLFFAFGLFLFQRSSGQNQLPVMEINKVILDEKALISFIDHAFVDTTYNSEELLNQNHSMVLEEFNKVLKHQNETYFLHDLPILELYAHRSNKQDVMLYLILDLDLEKIQKLSEELGLPNNLVSEEELRKGQFHFLTWDRKPINLWLSKDRFGNTRTNSKNRVILKVTNFKSSSLRNEEE
jgi:hypothetical protein